MKNPIQNKSSEWEDLFYFKRFLGYYVKRRHLGLRARFYMAGVLGFEPRDGGVKVRCLTAWRYPNKRETAMEWGYSRNFEGEIIEVLPVLTHKRIL